MQATRQKADMKNQTTMILLLAAVAGGGLFLFTSSQKKAAAADVKSSNKAEADAVARIAEAKAAEAAQKTEQGRLTLAGIKAQIDGSKGSFLDGLGNAAIGAGSDIFGKWAGSLW